MTKESNEPCMLAHLEIKKNKNLDQNSPVAAAVKK